MSQIALDLYAQTHIMKILAFLPAALLAGLVTQAQGPSLRRPGCTAVLTNTLFQAVDTTSDRGVADNYLTWEPGQVIRVKFMPGGGPVLRNKVIALAKEWEKFGNIKFQFLPDSEPKTDVRVKLGKDLGHNSAVGTMCNVFSQNEHTLHLDTLYLADLDYYKALILRDKVKLTRDNIEQVFRDYMGKYPNHWNEKELYATVVHEFGHALGLKHEQSFPGAIKWNKADSVYEYYYQTQGWGRDMVDHNVFNAADQFFTNGTAYDAKSIMHYPIEAWQTTDGYTVGNNYALSNGDKQLIASLYPRSAADLKRVVPKVQVNNFKGIRVNFNSTRNGLVIEPRLDLRTNARVGEVWIVARLMYEDGYYVPSNQGYYNWGGTVATYYKLNLLPNKQYSVNQAARNFEMFLPAQFMPSLDGDRVMVELMVILNDKANNQMNRLMYQSVSEAMTIRKR